MTSDTQLRVEGLSILAERLGVLEAERFVALIQREKFDYTEWQQTLWKGKSVEELGQEAMAWRNSRRLGKNIH